MRAFFIALSVYINFILESTLFRYLEIRSIKPNTAVALTVSFAILRGSVEGAVVGLLAGLLQDVVFGTSIGYYALIYMIIGYVCGLPNDSFFRDNFVLPLVFTVAGILFNGLFVFVTGFLIRGRFDFGFFFSRVILPETVYTAVFSFFVYRIVFGFNKKVEEYEHKKRKVF